MLTIEERERLRFLYIKHHSSIDYLVTSEDHELFDLVKRADLSKSHFCWVCDKTGEKVPAVALNRLTCPHHTLYHLQNDVARWKNPEEHLSLHEYSNEDVLQETLVPETGC